jgi:hypothetical protein
MKTLPYTQTRNFVFYNLAKDSKGVDKGTTRSTPGENEGARPPQKEEYPGYQEENKDVQAEEVDNEEKDKNTKSS